MQTILQVSQSREKTREAMGRYYHRKAKQQPNFKIGDMVILNVKNIRTKCQSYKLAPKLYGPFKILEGQGDLAYQLELSECWKIHPVFHVSLHELYRTSSEPTLEQLTMKAQEIAGDLA